MFICPRCSQEFKSYLSLSKHTRARYGLIRDTLYREYHKITDIPLCKCGCGTQTKWRSDRGYAEYATGHNSKGKTNVMFGKHHTEEAKRNISETRKDNFSSKKYTFITKEKWSEAAKKVWLRPGHKEKMSIIRKNYITNIGVTCNTSELEIKFSKILDVLGIQHKTQFKIDTKYYDFHIIGTNILIECDGDFWHCNPNTKYDTPIYDSQKHNKKNDIQKNELAEKKGYTLLRFWEEDILNNPQKVVSELFTAISSK